MSRDASRPNRKRRAIIVGGSMSGLFSAAFLRQVGWEFVDAAGLIYATDSNAGLFILEHQGP
jgi:hypothetical protein